MRRMLSLVVVLAVFGAACSEEPVDPGPEPDPDPVVEPDEESEPPGTESVPGDEDEPSEPDDAAAVDPEPEEEVPALPDPDRVASPCAEHEGRELEAFLDLVAPVDGQVVAGPEVEVVGCANVFEATVAWRLLDRDGTLLDEGNTLASCGTGCVGTFRTTVPVASGEGRGEVVLQVFWGSPRDGEPLDLAERTLRLE